MVFSADIWKEDDRIHRWFVTCRCLPVFRIIATFLYYRFSEKIGGFCLDSFPTLFRETSSPILAPLKGHLGIEEIHDPLKPPTTCLGWK